MITWDTPTATIGQAASSNGAERIPYTVTPEGQAVATERRMHAMREHPDILRALVDLAGAALLFAATWRVCYEGCECPRCTLYHETNALTDAVQRIYRGRR